MRAAIGTGGPDDRENAAAEVFRKLAASEPTLGRVRAGGGGSRPGEGLVLQRCEYISHAAVLRDTRPGVQIRDTECGNEGVRLGSPRSVRGLSVMTTFLRPGTLVYHMQLLLP